MTERLAFEEGDYAAHVQIEHELWELLQRRVADRCSLHELRTLLANLETVQKRLAESVHTAGAVDFRRVEELARRSLDSAVGTAWPSEVACEICGKTYRQGGGLTLHMTKMHPLERDNRA